MTAVTTLTSAPIAALLDRLFIDADKTEATMRQRIGRLPAAERAALLAPDGDYRALYHSLKDVHLAVSRETGRLLYMLARAIGARAIVEFGTSFAVSTLHLAAALRDNGGGRLITTEFEPAKAARARETIAAAGFSDLVEIREGDALETLSRDLPERIDFVLLDGAKPLYRRVLALLQPGLHAGSLVLADNADWSPDYLAHVRAAEGDYLSVPFGPDVELSMRLGCGQV